MATVTLDPPPSAYIVVAEVVHGPRVTPILGEGLYCSIECASSGVHELTDSLGRDERGAAFVLHHMGRPVGCVVTRGGRMWLVRILGSHELPAAA